MNLLILLGICYVVVGLVSAAILLATVTKCRCAVCCASVLLVGQAWLPLVLYTAVLTVLPKKLAFRCIKCRQKITATKEELSEGQLSCTHCGLLYCGSEECGLRNALGELPAWGQSE